MITICSVFCGILAGLIYALGLAGLAAAASQILDGVDGQFARLTNAQSQAGALLDSALDRYTDGAMVTDRTIYLIRLPLHWPLSLILILGTLAVVGSNLGSYTSARADSLNIELGRHSLASKGTRTTVIVLRN
ncbi:MAG: CDP-alcohol phosphatidyltransferase family protein [Deltaproteobacteria bacterium]|nr:CDP-alcohol phosphatidyltransferase family protein [Deltaproteobacteria bacterium]MBW2051499.1 CDP-alcohol phosphatidyltransferase family protein [Deltaproteobacteria bacterium]MBW2140353.1 CDP-alcohol phosphatidyltransferase family protein [Deltaproteobacteria bacterium]MBW2323724.1 CDP-alcohol phosphatidyltransferase family protein [Deltaproteobacteria bacterium]